MSLSKKLRRKAQRFADLRAEQRQQMLAQALSLLLETQPGRAVCFTREQLMRPSADLGVAWLEDGTLELALGDKPEG
jgi:hypothetical protein